MTKDEGIGFRELQLNTNLLKMDIPEWFPGLKGRGQLEHFVAGSRQGCSSVLDAGDESHKLAFLAQDLRCQTGRSGADLLGSSDYLGDDNGSGWLESKDSHRVAQGSSWC